MVLALGLIKTRSNLFQCANAVTRSLTLVAMVRMDGKLGKKNIMRPVISYQLGNQVDTNSPCQGEHSCIRFSSPNYFVLKILHWHNIFVFYCIPLLYGVFQYFSYKGVPFVIGMSWFIFSLWEGSWAGAISVDAAADVEVFPRSFGVLFRFTPLQYCLVLIRSGGLQEQLEHNYFIWPHLFLRQRCADALLWPS